MKRLLAIAIIIGIIAYVTVQVIKDRRFNHMAGYDYPLNENIDKDFYDPVVVKDYYRTVLEIGTFARSVWRTKMHDVRQPEQGDREENLDAVYYHKLVVYAQSLEAKLLESKRLKDQGFSKDEVQLMMEQGLTTKDLEFREKLYMIGLSRGSNGSAVWELQKMLNANGDSIPEDGIFNLITTNRLRQFQTDNDLFPSGEVDENTLKALLK